MRHAGPVLAVDVDVDADVASELFIGVQEGVRLNIWHVHLA